MLAAGTLLGPYRIVAPLGAGGMGEVYRAHDPRLGRDVAIKVLPARSLLSIDARARFEREARTISQLSHPHICTLFDVGREAETDFLVMELLEGETLAHRVARGALPVADVLRLGAEIASALDRAHAAGVVHRDLKPSNVMLTKSGAKLMDFGLARVAAAPGSASGAALTASPTMTQPLTSEGAIVGTFEYMAPEQLEGREADARADIWALGCVLYEMATGRHAFAASTQASLISAIMRDEPRPLTELQPLTPPALGHVVARCLAKDPADRWQSARDVAIGLELARPAFGATAARVTGWTLHPWRAWWPIALGALACLAVVFAIRGLVGQGPHATEAAGVAITRLTMQRGSVLTARFAPDGKSVFYCAAWNGDIYDIYETRPGSSVSRSLDLPGTRLRAISRDGTMAVQLADPTLGTAAAAWGKLALVPISGGTPRLVDESVQQADFASDGHTLLVTHRVSGRTRLEMPPGRVIHETAGDVWLPRVSPDGRHIAFIDCPFPAENDSRGSLVIADTSGRVLARSEEWNYPSGVAWSPDGREAWFSASQDMVSSDIRALSANGHERVIAREAGLTVLTDVAADGQVLVLRDHRSIVMRIARRSSGEDRPVASYDCPNPVAISSDGRSLLFIECGAFGGPQYAVCLGGTEGSAPVRLGPGGIASLSPDGRWAAAVQMGSPERLLLLPTGAGDSTSLPRGRISHYYTTGWTASGDSLVLTASESGRPGRTWFQDPKGGLPRPITPEGVMGTRISPDGRWLAATTSDGGLMAYALAGDASHAITTLLPGEFVSRWAADGRSVFTFTSGTSARLYRIDATSGDRSLWQRIVDPDSSGLWIGITVPMSPDGDRYAYSVWRQLMDLYLVKGWR